MKAVRLGMPLRKNQIRAMPDILKWRIAITPNTEGWAQGGPPVICVFLVPLLEEGTCGN